MRKTVDHESIKKRQIEASLSYSDAHPSEVTQVPWIYALRKKGEYPEATSRSGKLLIFPEEKDWDRVWVKIKGATEEGLLGGSSKVRTALQPNRYSKKVICVYVYDRDDEEDVMRIKSELRNLGIDQRIPDKTDKDTLDGKYARTGYKGLSKYYDSE